MILLDKDLNLFQNKLPLVNIGEILFLFTIGDVLFVVIIGDILL